MLSVSIHVLRAIVIQNCIDDGIDISANSSADISDSIIVNNGSDGIGVYWNSCVFITGTVTTKDNTEVGLELFSSSTAYIYDSTFASTGNDNHGISLSHNSSLNTNNSNLSLLTNESNGILASSSSSVGINSDSTVTVEDSGRYGIGVHGTSRLYSLGGINILRSQEYGFMVSDSADVFLGGPVKIEDCGDVGFLITQASSAYVKNRLEILNCVSSGITLIFGSVFQNYDTANIIIKNTQLPSGVGINIWGNSIMRAQGGTFLIESNGGEGVSVGRNSTISLRNRGAGLNATIKNNLNNGVGIYEQSIARIDGSTTIQNNTGWGIRADDGSSIKVRYSTIQDNGGAGVQNNINLGFGARSTLDDNTIGGTLNCDSSVLSRGTTVCP